MANSQRKNLRFVLVNAILMLVCVGGMAAISDLQGWNVLWYLFLYCVAFMFFWVILRNMPGQISLNLIWIFACLFRIVFIFTTPELSDDVYRFIWEGHLLLQGVNPYQFPVNSPMLDSYAIPYRALVNHNWLASPYLPVAQIGFALISLVSTNKVIAFQVASVFLDMASGWLIIQLLRRVHLPPQLVILYLWHPLIVIEFAQNAHFVEALMVFLTLASCALLLAFRDTSEHTRANIFSALILAGATLTKGLPGLFAFAFLPRWKWRAVFFYIFCVIVVCAGFGWGAGLGLSDPATGTGLFGAIRVYLDQWNFNGGILHWIELSLVGYQQTEVIRAGTTIRLILRGVSAGLTLGAAFFVNLPAWYWTHGKSPPIDSRSDLTFLKIAILPIGVYLLTAQTLYPWYLALILAFLPFFGGVGQDQQGSNNLFSWAWLYFSFSIFLVYLSYYKMPSKEGYILIQCVEYLPFYGILASAGWSSRDSLKHYFTRK